MTTLSDSQIAGLAQGAGFTGSQIPIMVAIALAESSGNPGATHTNSNGSTDYGLWQINSVHNFSGNLLDPQVNAAAARTVFNSQGFQAWSTYNSGAYTRYLGRGQAAAANPTAATGGSGGGNVQTVSDTSVSGSSALSTSVNTATSGSTWLRIGEFGLGSLLLIFAILRITGGDKIIIKGAKTAAEAAALA